MVAAPHSTNGVSGEVTTFYSPRPVQRGSPPSSSRVSVRTSTDRGVVHVEFAQFTWSTRRRAWVCWPKDVVRTIKNLEKLDESVFMPRLASFAALGDFILVGGKVGWVMRHLGRPVDLSAGIIFTGLRGYAVSTCAGVIELDAADVTFDPGRRMWLAKPASKPA